MSIHACVNVYTCLYECLYMHLYMYLPVCVCMFTVGYTKPLWPDHYLWLWRGGWKCSCAGYLPSVVEGKHCMAGVGVCPPQDELCQYCIIWGQ